MLLRSDRERIAGTVVFRDPPQITMLRVMKTVSDNIISYIEMCRREGASLQQGMNFGLGGNHSVILMSVRPNAPYRDRLEDSGTTLIYEGHDMPKGASCPNPKVVDHHFPIRPAAPRKTESFTPQRKQQRPLAGYPSEFECTRRSNQAFGLTTAYSTL